MSKLVVFTDMDGTLLDHHTYSHQAADGLLSSLEYQGTPVVPTTSKTFAELIPLRQELNNSHPFIVENGAAIYLPKSRFPRPPKGVEDADEFWLKRFVEPREHWRSLLETLAPEFGDCFTTFTQLGVEGISRATGLATDQAKLSSQRQFGEPIQWHGSEHQLACFRQAVAKAGGNTLVGGRFVHVSGSIDKGAAVLWLVDAYHHLLGQEVTSIALGDSGNDVAMLAAVDYPIVVRSPVHNPPSVPENSNNQQPIIITNAIGPEGWVEGVTQVLGLFTSI